MKRPSRKGSGGYEMPPQMAVQILELLEAEGISRNTVLAGTGIRPVLLERDDTYIPYHQMTALITRALALAPLQGLGMAVGASETISSWGILGYTMMSCATYREAFFTGLKFHQAASGMMALSAHEEHGRTCLTMDEPVELGPALPFAVEEMVFGIVAVVRSLVGQRLQVLELQVSYPAPDYARRYGEILGCPVHFNQSRNALWLQSPDNTALPNANPVSARMCRKLVEEMLDRHSVEENLVREVRRILMRAPGQIPDMETVARELGISSRSLRRRLGEFDTSFRALLDEVRKQLAIGYLRDSSMSLEHIASLLGYTEVTNFRRAFRQWTGKPPSQFRGSEVPA